MTNSWHDGQIASRHYAGSRNPLQDANGSKRETATGMTRRPLANSLKRRPQIGIPTTHNTNSNTDEHMVTNTITQASDPLSVLAVQINEQHDKALGHARSSLEHARVAGELLRQAKQQIPHGEWLAWLSANCKVSDRQAQRYLKVANNWQAITKNDAASYLTIDEAIAVCSKPVETIEQADTSSLTTRELLGAETDDDIAASKDAESKPDQKNTSGATLALLLGEDDDNAASKSADRKPHVSHNGGDHEWYSPKSYIEAARAVLGTIDLDPASSAMANKMVLADKFFTADDDGLSKAWHGNVWLNPPYAQPLCASFIEKLVDEYILENVTAALLLVNNATETQWFQMAARSATAICFPDKRVRFLKPDGEKGQPLQGRAVLYFGSDESKFVDAFEKFGELVARIGGAK